jgi:protein-tyrosine-phosphatase
MLNILVLCTGNSARSIIGEALFATQGAGRINAFSAGSQPSGRIQPLAQEIALEMGYPLAKMRSKSWAEFSNTFVSSSVSPHVGLDLIITVCGNAADEAADEQCPIITNVPGSPVRVHWGVDDPAHIIGTVEQRLLAFRTAERILRARVNALLALPIEQMNQEELRAAALAIGETVLD